MLEIYISGKDYYTRFSEHPDFVLPIRWFIKNEQWLKENRKLPRNAWKVSLETLPAELQEQIQRYKSQWENLLPKKLDEEE